MSEILEQDFEVPDKNIFVLSGPNLSKEISNKCIIVGHPRHDKTFYKNLKRFNKK